MTIRTGLIGYGLGGRCFHAPFIHATPGYELAAVLERHRNDSAKDYPGTAVVRSLEEMLDDKSIRLIVITTPNDTHYSYARQALEAGRMVVIDKPMTLTSAEAADLIRYARKNNLLLSVYQSRRYASDARSISKLLAAGTLGSVHEFEAQYQRYRPSARESWKETELAGSGILYDLGPHLIDQALQLFGKPDHIYAEIKQQRSHARTDDYFHIHLHFGPVTAILRAGLLVLQPGPRYQIHGDKGSFIKYGDDPQDAALRAGERPGRPGWGEEPEAHHGWLYTQGDNGVISRQIPSLPGNFGLFYEQLHRAVLEGAALPVEPEEGYNVIRLIELARESADSGRLIPCTGWMDHP